MIVELCARMYLFSPVPVSHPILGIVFESLSAFNVQCLRKRFGRQNRIPSTLPRMIDQRFRKRSYTAPPPSIRPRIRKVLLILSKFQTHGTMGKSFESPPPPHGPYQISIRSIGWYQEKLILATGCHENLAYPRHSPIITNEPRGL